MHNRNFSSRVSISRVVSTEKASKEIKTSQIWEDLWDGEVELKMLYQTEKIITAKELESIWGWTCAFSILEAYFIST